MDLRFPYSQSKCSYNGCQNLATGKCSGSQNCIWQCDDEGYAFKNNCGGYFCTDHLIWGWGLPCVNCCIATKQCPIHHTGIYCCTIL
jgi:hypothetical protein